jgi:hypothetical protein
VPSSDPPVPSAAPSAAPSSASAAPAIDIAGGVVTINPDALAPLFYAPPADGSVDPFYHLHTSPDEDGFFLSVEAYTVYGSAWTGQTGTFAIDCSPAGTGICVHFDPDGSGPLANLGSDFLATGEITIVALGEAGFDVTLSEVAFSDGTTIPGPLRLVFS